MKLAKEEERRRFPIVEVMGSLQLIVYSCVLAVISINASSHPTGSGCAKQVWRKLNDAKVCFGAADGTNGKFNSMFGMNIYELKYVRRDGFHECEYGYGGYWGCEMYPHASGSNDHHHNPYPESGRQPTYHIHVQGAGHQGRYYNDEEQHDDRAEKNNDEPTAPAGGDQPANDEPQAHDFQPYRGAGPLYLHQLCVFLTDKDDDVLMPQQPFSGAYYTVPGLQRPAWDTSVELHVYGGPMAIQHTQELRLYHGEDLFNVDHSDNSGNLCIDVYGYGDIVYAQS